MRRRVKAHKGLRIGITLGDINGIGPEVVLKALSGNVWPADVEFALVGSAPIVEAQARAFRRAPDVLVLDPLPASSLAWKPGKIDPKASACAAEWIRAAANACLAGELDAMVTAPISKEGFHRAGVDVPGHTEFLAELTGTKRYAMMLFGGPLRVVLATRHVPLARVPRLITKATVREAIEMAARALPWLGFPRGRIAVCGLNPHAGENGDIGKEDLKVIKPVVDTMRRKGVRVSGPHPGDTVFHHAARGAFDVVVAMYHDQGLAPLKLIAFDKGVNLTLGLPIIRTSPDHGTAFDLAGKNQANPSSMTEAIRQAIALARRGNPWAR